MQMQVRCRRRRIINASANAGVGADGALDVAWCRLVPFGAAWRRLVYIAWRRLTPLAAGRCTQKPHKWGVVANVGVGVGADVDVGVDVGVGVGVGVRLRRRSRRRCTRRCMRA